MSKEAITLGADYLDLMMPGWRIEIDRDRLDLSSPRDCILGQLFGAYEDALGALSLNQVLAVAMGFDVAVEDPSPEDYLDLQTEWQRVLSLPKTSGQRLVGA